MKYFELEKTFRKEYNQSYIGSIPLLKILLSECEDTLRPSDIEYFFDALVEKDDFDEKNKKAILKDLCIKMRQNQMA